MRNTIKYADKLFAVFTFLFSLAFIISVCIQIFSRTFLPKVPSWTEEVSRYTFIYSIAFAAGLAVRANSFVSVDIFTSRIPQRFQHTFQIVMNFILMAFCLFVEIRCVYKFAFFKLRMVSTALEIPMQYIYFSMFLLFGLLSLCYLFEAILLLQNQTIEEVAT